MTHPDTSTAAVEARCQHLDHVAHDRRSADAALMRALAADRGALQAENDRLRGVLEEMAQATDCGCNPCYGHPERDYFVDAAHAALQEVK